MSLDVNIENIKSVPLNILVVDDSEPDILITKRAFNNAKIKNNIFVVNDGQECLDFVRKEGVYEGKAGFPKPDIILMDINMPRMSGLDVLRILKGDDVYKSIPVIMMSGSKNQQDISTSYLFGANSFIQKPVEYGDFVKVVDVFNIYWHVVNKLPRRED